MKKFAVTGPIFVAECATIIIITAMENIPSNASDNPGILRFPISRPNASPRPIRATAKQEKMAGVSFEVPEK